jgi:hypothetical protein
VIGRTAIQVSEYWVWAFGIVGFIAGWVGRSSVAHREKENNKKGNK